MFFKKKTRDRLVNLKANTSTDTKSTSKHSPPVRHTKESSVEERLKNGEWDSSFVYYEDK